MSGRWAVYIGRNGPPRSGQPVTRHRSAEGTGRPGTTQDVAATVVFLASPEAGHLTGQVIHVNGGAYLGR